MSLTPWLPVVRKIKDGEAVEQATVNVPIDQLTQRDQHLFEKFEEVAGKSVLISFDQPMHPDETFNVGELSLTYYKQDASGEGLAKGISGFNSSSSSSMFTANNSNYSFGITKTIYLGTRSADVFTEGLCEFDVDIDDAKLGLLQQINGVVESFSVGPYFLSSKSKGKITKDPSGIPVYVGYAVSKRKFLLHTVVPEFSQFFINYRYNILDRVAGVPVLNTTWSITNPDLTKLGWIPAASAGVSSIPPGALFYYNIPTPEVLATDTGLSIYERAEASELLKYLPPVPSNFIQLYVDGLLSRFKDTFDTAGTYSINEYGLWWHSNTAGNQPWSSQYPQTAQTLLWNPCLRWRYVGDPTYTNVICTLDDIRGADTRAVEFSSAGDYIMWRFVGSTKWTVLQAINTLAGYDAGLFKQVEVALDSTSLKTSLDSSRKKIFTSFSQFNPALKTQLVHSLQTSNTEVNKSGNFIKFYNRDNPTQTATTGDLVVDITPVFDHVGYLDTLFQDVAQFPASRTGSYATNRAIAALAFHKPSGTFKTVVTPVVSKLVGVGGISVTEQAAGTGVWNVSYRGQGMSGQVDSIEPINSRLEFIKLTSYLKLPPPSQTPVGLVGKIVLPKGYSNGNPLNLVFHMFGDIDGLATSPNRTVAFSFEYSAVSAYNGASPTIYTKVDNFVTFTPTTNPVEFELTPFAVAYAANTSVKVGYTELAGSQVPLFSIPGEFIHEDTVVNFKIMRVATTFPAYSYVGNIGILGVYWEIPNA
jgi:hypothetical protein